MFSLDLEQAAARIDELDGFCRAFICTRLDDARREARERRQEPARSVLHGVPYALKDLWDTADLPTSCGSERHRHRRPTEDCPQRRAFDEAGAVLLGKTNMSDLALAPEATSWIGGATRNPFDPSRTAGGSSGGSAAAVALGMAGFDWGSDFGGSIRLPAAFCGVLGMRLSTSTWPVHGGFPEVPESVLSLNGQGPITRTVPQMRAVLEAAAPRARHRAPGAFAIREVVSYAPDHGHWRTFGEDTRSHLAAIGRVREAALPRTTAVRNLAIAMYAAHFDDMLAAEPTVTFAEGVRATVSAVLLRGAFGDRRVHPSTAKILLLMALGRYTLFRDKRRVVARVDAFREQVRREWDRGAIVAMPVCAFPPPRIGTSTDNTQLISCCVPGNLVDATTISVPFGSFDVRSAGAGVPHDPGRLPRALQLMGPPGSEDALLDAAEALMVSRDRDPALRFDAGDVDIDALARANRAYTAE
jgi:Asp-tRNA(Asn)/Glu-tRNA(Gln) amidotransferase A subunit family amidase